ncbi:hypothetical protein YPPY32_1461 [Yersinia pestis PY-32]|nr:hypothetical protein YPPY32_1461 [Yersinia pestis PY-32]EIT00186.1 hypothetical protein YPPY89_1338 [Yersinia pestis PY-89]EIT61406.1 hypothetical protein YPPY103_1301 [Yersinia pestis PY-103]
MLFCHKAHTRRLRPVGMGDSLGAVTEWLFTLFERSRFQCQ